MKKTQVGKSMYDNTVNYNQYLKRLTELSMSMFEWSGLPDTIDERYLELSLFYNGAVVFFNDDVIGHLALNCMLGGALNVYDVPTIITAYASNGYNKQLNAENSVIIWNNMLRTNSITDVTIFAERLYDIDEAIMVNAKAQKTPILINCPDNQRLTMKNLYMQYDGNTPVIFGSDKLNPKSLSVLKTDAPFLGNDLYTLKEKIWNEALTYLGITNVATKKERMITYEAYSTLGGVIASRYSRLEMRRQACKKINQMFGLNIWCNYRDDLNRSDSQDETVNDLDEVNENE